MNTVYVAYPAAFKCFPKIERKLDKILRTLSDFGIVCTDDPNGFLRRYCDDQAPPIALRIRPTSEIFTEITHAVIFNDGEALDSLSSDIKARGIPVRDISTPITRVVNKDKSERYDVYIGRGTPWGNPYAVGFGNGPDEAQDDRDEAIRKFRYDFERDFLRGGRQFKHQLLQLRGKRLGCHCKPLACHGDVLAEYLNSLDDGK